MEGNRKTNGNESVKQCIYGRNVVRQVLQDPSRVYRVWLSGDDREIEELCRAGGVPVKKVSRKELRLVRVRLMDLCFYLTPNMLPLVSTV